MFEQCYGILILRSEAAQQGDARNRERDERADQAVAHQRAPREAGLFICDLEYLGCSLANRLIAGNRVTLIDRLMVGHKGLAPVHCADTDGEQREGHADTDEHGVQTDLPQIAGLNREEHVRENRAKASYDREVEERVDGALCTLVTLGVEIGDPLTVRGKTGVLNDIGRDDRGTCRCACVVVALSGDNGGFATAVLRFLCHDAPCLLTVLNGAV